MHALEKIKTSFPLSLIKHEKRKQEVYKWCDINLELQTAEHTGSARCSDFFNNLMPASPDVRRACHDSVRVTETIIYRRMTVSGLQKRLFTVGYVGALSSWRFHLHKKLNSNISEIIPNSTNTSVLTLLRISLQNSITAI